MEKVEKLFWDIDELAEALLLSSSTLYADYKSMEIPYVKLGGALRFPIDKVKIWIENNTQQGTNNIKNRKTKVKRKCQYTSKLVQINGQSILPTRKGVSEKALEKLLREKRGKSMKI